MAVSPHSREERRYTEFIVLALSRRGAVENVFCSRPVEGRSSRYCPLSSSWRDGEQQTLSMVLAPSRARAEDIVQRPRPVEGGEPWTLPIVLALSRGTQGDTPQFHSRGPTAYLGCVPPAPPNSTVDRLNCGRGRGASTVGCLNCVRVGCFHSWLSELRKGWVLPQLAV